MIPPILGTAIFILTVDGAATLAVGRDADADATAMVRRAAARTMTPRFGMRLRLRMWPRHYHRQAHGAQGFRPSADRGRVVAAVISLVVLLSVLVIGRAQAEARKD